MANLVFGHDINHVLLLHLGAFSSTILPQLLDLLPEKGLRLMTLEEAQVIPPTKPIPMPAHASVDHCWSS
jgi:peptidoglycan-N-acetylglucosamine deacetylase